MKEKKSYQLVASFCLLFLMLLGYTIKFYPSMIQPLDSTVQEKIISLREPILTHVLTGVTTVFNPVQVSCLVVVITLLLFLLKRKVEGIWFFALMLGSSFLNLFLKLVFARSRPQVVQLVVEKGQSFPSGHTTASCVFFLVFIFLIGLWEKKRGIALCLQLFCLLGMLVVAFSRIYLGVHYPSDTIGGELLALSLILFTYPLMEKQRFIQRFGGKQK